MQNSNSKLDSLKKGPFKTPNKDSKNIKSKQKQDQKAHKEEQKLKKTKQNIEKTNKSKSEEISNPQKKTETENKKKEELSKEIEKEIKKITSSKLEEKVRDIKNDKTEEVGFYSAFHKILKQYETQGLKDMYKSFIGPKETKFEEMSTYTKPKELITIHEVDTIIMNQKLKSIGINEGRPISLEVQEAYKLWVCMTPNRVLSFVKYTLSLN